MDVSEQERLANCSFIYYEITWNGYNDLFPIHSVYNQLVKFLHWNYCQFPFDDN